MSLLDRLRTTIGDSYDIERELGGGGMSRVFLAEDVRLRRKVVVKVLSPELSSGMDMERFRREILLAAQLQHPHIVPVLTAGDADGLPYFTMPFVSGSSLRDRIDANGGRGLGIAECVGMLRDVARALAFAHRQGVVHRDIKPGNILLAGNSAAVTDFGIAKAIATARAEGSPHLTQTGSSLGTPAYMAPEQAAADPGADHRVDIYAFGVVAYETITGHTPFHGRQPHEMLRAHLVEAPVPITGVRPDTPARLAALVMRTLEKDPDARPSDADELIQELAEIDTGTRSGIRSPAVRRRVPRGAWLGAAGVIAIALAVWAFLALRGEPQPTQPDLVAVMPFRIASANTELHYLREGMLDLFAAKLTGEGGLRATEPRSLLSAWREAGGTESSDLAEQESMEVARELGATRVLLGEVVGTPLRLMLNVRVRATNDDRDLAQVSVEGAPDSLAWLVDRLTVQLLAELSPDDERQRTASLTSTSLPALRAYLDGQAKLRRGDVFAATKEFDRALNEDSTFALAGLGLRLATAWYNDQALTDRGTRIAWRERERLSPRDRALLTAVVGPRYPAESSTREFYDARIRYLGMAGDRAEAWYLVGDYLYHYGLILGVEDSQRRALDHFKRASDLDSTYMVALLHAPGLAVTMGDTGFLRRVVRLRLASDTSRSWLLPLQWNEAIQAGDSATAAAVWDSLSRYPDRQDVLWAMVQHAVVEAVGVADAKRATDSLIGRSGTDDARSGAHNVAADFALLQGQPSRALRHRRAGASISTDRELADRNLNILLVRDAMLGDGDTAAAIAAVPRVERMSRQPITGDTVTRSFVRAAIRALEPWRLSRGDTSQTRASIETLRAIMRTPGFVDTLRMETEIAVIEAMLATVGRHGDLRAKAVRLDSLLRATDYSRTHVGRYTVAAVVAARALEATGDLPGALAAARRRHMWNDISSPYLAAQLREEGRLATLTGDREGAIRAYRHYLALRSEPEPAVAAQVAAVRAELRRLERESVGR
jgi:serine/threonine-protein kinase